MSDQGGRAGHKLELHKERKKVNRVKKRKEEEKPQGNKEVVTKKSNGGKKNRRRGMMLLQFDVSIIKSCRCYRAQTQNLSTIIQYSCTPLLSQVQQSCWFRHSVRHVRAVYFSFFFFFSFPSLLNFSSESQSDPSCRHKSSVMRSAKRRRRSRVQVQRTKTREKERERERRNVEERKEPSTRLGAFSNAPRERPFVPHFNSSHLPFTCAGQHSAPRCVYLPKGK